MAQGTTTNSTSMIWTTSVGDGVVGGLTGGVVFGLMQAFDMTPIVVMLVGSEAVAVGWLVHLLSSVIFGAVYGPVAGARPMAAGMQLAMGAAHGLVLWVVGALLLMPALLGKNLLSSTR